VSATEAATDSSWEASKGYADVEEAHAETEVNVGKVQEARKTAEVTKANIVNTEDADAEIAESAIGSNEARKSQSTAEIAKAEGINASPRSKAVESTGATPTAIGETVPPNEVASAETEEVDAAPEECLRGVDVNVVQTVKAGIIEAPKAPEELAASATSINQAVATVGNFPETMKEARGEAVAAAGSFPETTEEAGGEVVAAAGSFSETTEEARGEVVATSSDDATQPLILEER
jgi:hypothetical protein